jgi:hypothetical protein
VALVGDHRVAIGRRPPDRGRHQAQQPPARVGPAEADHLDRNGVPGAEPLDQLGRLGHHHQPGRGQGDELLAQQRSPAPLDQVELPVQLVGAIERKVQDAGAVQLDQLDTGRPDQGGGALGGDSGPQRRPRAPAGADRLHQREHRSS